MAVAQTQTVATNGASHHAPLAKVLPLRGTECADGGKTRLTAPIPANGSLDKFSHYEMTPIIGRAYGSDLQASKLLEMSEEESMPYFQELARTISHRGVLFLKNQDITPQQMKGVMERLKKAAGSPESSSLHIHPLTEESSELGDQIAVISSEKQKKGGGLLHFHDDRSQLASNGWHSDITFERVPSDYAMLKIHTLPEVGGDTMWASAYELYDRLSPAMAKMMEGLTATHNAHFFHDEAARLGQPIRAGMRGSPLNYGPELEAVHPVIRTNPVSGWKGVFVNPAFTKRINGVTKDESDMLLKHIFTLLTQNHDLQVRYRWEKNDMAIWDNRSTFHIATYDYSDPRAGDRCAGVGERPYLDHNSMSRREALAQEA